MVRARRRCIDALRRVAFFAVVRRSCSSLVADRDSSVDSLRARFSRFGWPSRTTLLEMIAGTATPSVSECDASVRRDLDGIKARLRVTLLVVVNRLLLPLVSGWESSVDANRARLRAPRVTRGVGSRLEEPITGLEGQLAIAGQIQCRRRARAG